MLTKKEFIKRFKLTNTNKKGYFNDGIAEKNRTIYADPYGNFFVFYANDLHTFTPYKTCNLSLDIICGKLGAGYSWYH